MNNFKYLKNISVDEAIKTKENCSGSFFIAGGTNLLDLWKYNIEHPQALLDINGFDALKSVQTLNDGSTKIGALLTNSDTAYHREIENKYPLLSRAILAGASAQIRNSATNGGNLLQKTRCYYYYDTASPCNKRNPGSGCPAIAGKNRMHAILGHSDQCIAVFPSDMCIALAALEAKVEVLGPDGERTIQFEDFHTLPGSTPEIDNTLQPDELITGLILPAQGFSKNYSYLKLRDRNSYAFALISVATGLEIKEGTIEKARIAVGGIAHKPWRRIEGEKFLDGKEPSHKNFREAAEIIIADATGFEHNNFKIELTKKAIVRNCFMALDPASSQRPGAAPSL